MRKPKVFAAKSLSLLMALLVMLAMLPVGIVFTSAYSSTVTFTFSDNSVVASNSNATGYEISGTELAIKESGVYTVTGSCTNGNIVVKKGTTDVVLILKNLTLSCDYTAPFACNKTTEVTAYVSGSVSFTDKENPADETSSDTTVADAFEGAAIKVKSGASLVIEGDGTLNADGSACKNGIKGGATANITVNMAEVGNLKITAANSGLASDGNVLIKGGNIDIKAANEGIKSAPDEGDTASAGLITITGGNIKADTVSLSGGDGIQAANGINISGGTFDIDAYGDGIQSDTNLSITNGKFDIKTLNGYNSSNFNSSTMSAKGIKASSTEEAVENATNLIEISGGSFKINTPDDAVHSDGTVTITGGTFDIYTGDDGVHADTALNLGASDKSGLERDPYITVNSSYEGLEAGTVNIYGGKYYVVASDDGVNSAGGSDSNVQPGFGGGRDHFNPGGNTSSGSYSLNVYGGSIYVISGGDGLDSNGPLNMTGGTAEVWSASSGADSPLDADGTVTVNGATVFAAGAAGMGGIRPSGSQAYTTSTTRISASSLVSVKAGSSAVYNTVAPRAASYSFFSAPNVSSPAISVSGSSADCKIGSPHNHSFDSGTVTKAATETDSGVMTYTCTACGYTEGQTIPVKASADDVVIENNDIGYNITFNTNGNCKINVYHTQDYLNANETDVTSAVSRNSATGKPDSTGDGQINFTVIPKSGYTVLSITATDGLYKNIKDVSADAGVPYTYRITKITGELTVTVNIAVAPQDSTIPSATSSPEIIESTSILPPAETENISVTVIENSSSTIPAQPDDIIPTQITTDPDEFVTTAPDSADATGTTKPVQQTSSVPVDSGEKYLYGDVDLNGQISVKDVTLIQKMLAKFTTFNELQSTLADVNASASVSIADATTIQKYCAFLITDFASGKWCIIS